MSTRRILVGLEIGAWVTVVVAGALVLRRGSVAASTPLTVLVASGAVAIVLRLANGVVSGVSAAYRRGLEEDEWTFGGLSAPDRVERSKSIRHQAVRHSVRGAVTLIVAAGALIGIDQAAGASAPQWMIYAIVGVLFYLARDWCLGWSFVMSNRKIRAAKPLGAVGTAPAPSEKEKEREQAGGSAVWSPASTE